MTPQDKASLSARQRSEQIYNEIWTEDIVANRSMIIALISAEILAYAHDAVRFERKLGNSKARNAAELARAEALEEAAKLFEQPCHCPEQAFDCDHVDAPASRIRALIPKDKP